MVGVEQIFADGVVEAVALMQKYPSIGIEIGWRRDLVVVVPALADQRSVSRNIRQGLRL